MYDHPGVYALLIGSGTSRAAGIPTGWGVIKDLVARAATASPDPIGQDPTDDEVESWWRLYGDGGELGYASLLENLGYTAASRSGILNGYFEPTDKDRENQTKVPRPAHAAIAQLAVSGYIRVIVTTNFDDLLEQALRAAGVPHQVVSSESDIEAMKPLVHAKCTVVKVHGDYRSLAQRNTINELSSYSSHMTELLEDLFEDHGLVINGWSADWDTALVSCLKGRRSRRYPLYWSTLSDLGVAASTLAELHEAGLIQGTTADEFFPDLMSRVEALEGLSAPPLSEEMSLARLKKLLPYRESYVELRDLLDRQIQPIMELVRVRGFVPSTNSGETVGQAYFRSCKELRDVSAPLIRIVSTGVLLDRDRHYTDLWTWALQSLLNIPLPRNGEGYNETWMSLSRYPAGLLLRAIAMIGASYDREDVFVHVSQKASARLHWRDEPLPAFVMLQDAYLLDWELLHEDPLRMRQHYPASTQIADDLTLVIGRVFDDIRDAETALRRMEYRMALTKLVFGHPNPSAPNGGAYIAQSSWDRGTTNRWEMDFRQFGDHQAWGWTTSSDGENDTFSEQLENFSTNQLRPLMRY